MKESKMLRCLVKKPEGQGISCATKLGFAVNLYCAEGYMWLKLPNVSIEDMEEAIKLSGFEKASEVEYEFTSKSDNTKRCLVKKPEGQDISCATKIGFAVNLHCAEDYMWIKLPDISFEEMENAVKYSGFEKVSEVESI